LRLAALFAGKLACPVALIDFAALPPLNDKTVKI
jgi:hypothetical protein